jgi:hypothetical protein
MAETSPPNEVTDVMKEAVKAVEEAGVPDDLRETAFQKVFEALMALHLSELQSAERGPEGETGRSRADAPLGGSGGGGGPSLQSIAARLGLDVELVEEIFYVDGDVLGLAIAPSKFDAKKAAATQEIALLLAAGRQSGGWEEWTPVGAVREACRDYGRFDVANFATTIKRMGDVFSFRGRARQLEVRVTRPGYEKAGLLARELSGVGS